MVWMVYRWLIGLWTLVLGEAAHWVISVHRLGQPSPHTLGRSPAWQRSTLAMFSMKQFCNKHCNFSILPPLSFIWGNPKELPYVDCGIDICYTGPSRKSPWVCVVMAIITCADQSMCNRFSASTITEANQTVNLGVFTFISISSAQLPTKKSYDTF